MIEKVVFLDVIAGAGAVLLDRYEIPNNLGTNEVYLCNGRKVIISVSCDFYTKETAKGYLKQLDLTHLTEGLIVD